MPTNKPSQHRKARLEPAIRDAQKVAQNVFPPWTTRVGVGAGCEVWNRVYMIAPVSPDVSPQERNLAEWDWVPIFLQNKYGGECRHGKTMTFCSVLSFPASKHQENVFMIFCYGRLRHQEACCMNSSWVTSLIMIRHLGKFSTLRVYKLRFSLIIHRTWIFERPACSISLSVSTHSGIKTLFFILNM